jgi:hypothetical protein
VGKTSLPMPPSRTAVHAFAVDQPGPAAYRASGLVEGTVADRWSLSEHAGHLRVVTTTGPSGCSRCPGSQSQVSVLTERSGELAVVGTAGDMGKGEMVKAVRFIGDRGYVVTFRQIDPLYVLDLADPAKPRVAGELKIPGYSAYLHPVGPGKLLGIGQEGTARGAVESTKVALYDVSDPATPREIGQQVLPRALSEVERDARAFLWWEPSRLALVPVTGPFDGRNLPPHGVAGFRVGDTEVAPAGRVDVDGAGGSLRSVVIGERVFVVADQGVRSSELATLRSGAWLPLPAT